MIKALFFDIDGTLVSFKTHTIPQSTIDALIKAKEKGVKIFISTGRPLPFINNLQDINNLIDGYMTTNGGFCFIGDKVVSQTPIPKEDVYKIIEFARIMDFSCVVVGEKDIAIYNYKEIVDEIFHRMLNVDYDFSKNSIEDVLQQNILQITPFITQTQEEEIMPILKGCFSARWYPLFTDITASNVNKGNALIEMANYENIDIDETMALGDGGNDISIVQKAGVGVAMGNAGEELKKFANFITSSVDEDGVMKALKHYNVI